jgi:hypothetical protein
LSSVFFLLHSVSSLYFILYLSPFRSWSKVSTSPLSYNIPFRLCHVSGMSGDKIPIMTRPLAHQSSCCQTKTTNSVLVPWLGFLNWVVPLHNRFLKRTNFYHIYVGMKVSYPLKAVVLKLWGATRGRKSCKGGAAYFPTDKNENCPKSIRKITKK